MREQSDDSRWRLKANPVVQKDAPMKFGPKQPLTEDRSMATIETLAKAANDWRQLKWHMSHAEGSEILRKLTERDPLLASSLRNDLNQGTLRFQTYNESRPKSLTNLEFELLDYPHKVSVFKKVLNRKPGRLLFNLIKRKIVKVTDHTFFTDKGKVVRKNHISLKSRTPKCKLTALNTSKANPDNLYRRRWSTKISHSQRQRP